MDPGGRLDQNAARIICIRVRELRSLAPQALDPAAGEAQHDMRIAAKRLRYALEVTGACFGGPATVARRRSRALQDLLGDLHDCDVMLPRAEAELERLRGEDARAIVVSAGEAEDVDAGLVTEAPNRTAYRGLELLIVHQRAQRALLFERFRDFWRTEEARGTFDALERLTSGDRVTVS